MPRWIALSATLVMLVSAATPVLRAQQQPRPDPPTNVDVSKLPLNVARLQRQLREAVEREQRDGVVLRYTVNVFQQAPPLKLFTPQDNLRFGPTPSTAPTHKEMMSIVSPRWVR